MSRQRLYPGLGLDFDTLRSEGIRYLQELSGQRWTDYNLHDPGVTILEQLCFIMTDMGYRTDFEVADYLTQADGSIDYQRLALFKPQQIFTGQALTTEDYRKLLFDAIPQITDIWVRPLDATGNGIRRGLLIVYLMLSDEAYDTALAKTTQHIMHLVNAIYSANRSLCEDLAEVRLLKPVYYYLQGEIDIQSDSSAAEILAQILFDCANHISAGLSQVRFKTALDGGLQPEHIFEGPLTYNAYITASPDDNERSEFQITELIPVILAVPGVRQVRNLYFVAVNETGSTERLLSLQCNLNKGIYPRLKFPDGSAESCLTLFPETNPLISPRYYSVQDNSVQDQQIKKDRNRALYSEAQLDYQKMMFEQQTLRSKDVEQVAAMPLPAGKYRYFAQYYSIQQYFPAIYGINRYGLPSSASAQRKAQARQLKAYLFPFEQIIANFLQNLDDLPNLFSADLSVPQTYFSQFLKNPQIPDIETLYSTQTLNDPASLLEKQRRYDDYFQRKGRVLDYLLALYGEEFSQIALKRFNQCHRDRTEEWLLSIKAQFLREIPDLNSHRVTGFDYLKQTEGKPNVARLQKRMNILLGIVRPDEDRYFSKAFASTEVNLCNDAKFFDDIPLDLTLSDHTMVPSVDPFRPLPAPDFLFHHIQVSPTFLRNGVFLNNYRLVSWGKHVAVVYVEQGKTCFFEPLFADVEKAATWVHHLIKFLLGLNKAGEGMHIVEHLLLRPTMQITPADQLDDTGLPCYENRISVVLLADTVRFFDKNFQSYVERIFRVHCPAHLVASFHWLTLAEMRRFEAHYKIWRDRLRLVRLHSTWHEGDALLDQAAMHLLKLLCPPAVIKS